MPRRPALGTTLAALCAFMALTACQGSPEAGQPNATPAASPTSATPSSSPTPTDSTEAQAAAAQAGYRAYIAAKVATAASGGTNVAGLSKVATGVMLSTELNQAATYKSRRWHAVGEIEVIWTKALKVGAAGANGQITEITVQACVDASKVTAVDAQGKNVKPTGAPSRWIDEMQMHFDQNAWKAYYGMNQATKC
ncbi:MAG TPA: hypothetical protein VGL05_31520 [Kribbella sp.]